MKTVLHIGKFQRAATQQRKKHVFLPSSFPPSLSLSFCHLTNILASPIRQALFPVLENVMKKDK